ncbi:thioredoxin family protein [Mucilaginibacter sp.]|uniref:DUF1223 domain-containing protein n=1 Tax=Mucilaginibacter sp. TaxID=1882438 RepID=UPI0026339C94|nr:DUF1223 domain-containing protein [Mucilaginibacter sp.]MDB5130181.1 hypothetical protein [Mucilaginibacter sp.]
MKTIKSLGLSACFMTILGLAACGQNNGSTKKDTAKISGKGFAVLELFTSEGCSSCPPADELLAKIQKEAQGKDIYLLAYHVDYWDRLGWKDVFSNAEYSKRQEQYGRWFNLSQIYTPQLIVNGKAEFVGSNEAAIRNAISDQLSTKANVNLVLHAQPDGGGLKVHYQASNIVKGSNLLIAVVQKNAQSKVERGENAGNTLSHVQIVRKVQNEPLSATGEGSSIVELPKGFDTQNWEVLGLIQDQSNGEILGAAKADLGVNANAKK